MSRQICIRLATATVLLQVSLIHFMCVRLAPKSTCLESSDFLTYVVVSDVSALQSLKNYKLKQLGKYVQSRMEDIQGGKGHCEDGQYFECALPTCGFTCSVHFLIPCILLSLQSHKPFVVAFRNRTDTRVDFIDLKRDTFEYSFLPVDRPCDVTNTPIPMTKIKGNNTPFEFDLTSIPSDVIRSVRSLHSNPTAWWMGQAASYLLKFRPEVEKKIVEGFDFNQETVGIHIRRTDKLKHESEYHTAEEYMAPVEDWFTRREVERRLFGKMESLKKRIFVVTDDPTALDEIIEKYPDYDVEYDMESIQNAYNKKARYTDIGIQHVALDVFRLTKCSHIVCTMTSNICRLVYELMQVKNGDDQSSVKSIDWRYNYHKAALPSWHVAVMQHLPSRDNELMLEIGDKIKPMTQEWRSGYWKGLSERSRKIGLYPSNKVVDFVNIR